MQSMFIKTGAVVLALSAALTLSGCTSTAHQDNLAGKGFVYEKGGFPDRFGIQLYDDGSFTYYAGAFSSYVGYGMWELDGDTLILLEDADANGISNIFKFKVGKDSLSYIAEESDKFMYVDVGDGEKFTEEKLNGFPF